MYLKLCAKSEPEQEKQKILLPVPMLQNSMIIISTGQLEGHLPISARCPDYWCWPKGSWVLGK